MNIFNPWRKFLLQEAGFNRIRNILLGKVASVDTVGFMTAENPMAQKLSAKENREFFSSSGTKNTPWCVSSLLISISSLLFKGFNLTPPKFQLVLQIRGDLQYPTLVLHSVYSSTQPPHTFQGEHGTDH